MVQKPKETEVAGLGILRNVQVTYKTIAIMARATAVMAFLVNSWDITAPTDSSLKSEVSPKVELNSALISAIFISSVILILTKTEFAEVVATDDTSAPFSFRNFSIWPEFIPVCETSASTNLTSQRVPPEKSMPSFNPHVKNAITPGIITKSEKTKNQFLNFTKFIIIIPKIL